MRSRNHENKEKTNMHNEIKPSPIIKTYVTTPYVDGSSNPFVSAFAPVLPAESASTPVDDPSSSSIFEDGFIISSICGRVSIGFRIQTWKKNKSRLTSADICRAA